MPDRPWKRNEREVAEFLGTKRAPVHQGITKSDTFQKNFYIEVKRKKKWAIFTLFRDTEKKAKKEGKIPIVATKEHNQQGFLLIVKSTDLDRLIKERAYILQLNADS